MDEGTDALLDGCMKGKMDRWTIGRMDEGTDGLMDGWTKGQMH